MKPGADAEPKERFVRLPWGVAMALDRARAAEAADRAELARLAAKVRAALAEALGGKEGD